MEFTSEVLGRPDCLYSLHVRKTFPTVQIVVPTRLSEHVGNRALKDAALEVMRVGSRCLITTPTR